MISDQYWISGADTEMIVPKSSHVVQDLIFLFVSHVSKCIDSRQASGSPLTVDSLKTRWFMSVIISFVLNYGGYF